MKSDEKFELRPPDGDGGSKEAILRTETAIWVQGLAPWQVISHMTFKWEASLDSGRRCYEKFMREELWGVTYFYALERNPSRDGYHVHALWCDCLGKSRRRIWQEWFDRYGRARIEPVKSDGDVARYCAKYVTKEAKEGGWWNVKVYSHRTELDGAGFKLDPGA